MAITFKEETAPNIEDLKKMASNKRDANLRLQSVEELGKWKCRQSIDILWRLMLHDLVYEIQNASFLRLQAFGEDVRLPKKAKGNLIKQIDKKIEKLLKSIDGQIMFSEFVDVFKDKMPEEYDVYIHDKKSNFEKWLKNILSNFTTDIRSKIKDDNA